MDKVPYQEKQKFNQPFVWIILVFFLIFQIYIIYQQIFLKSPVTNNPLPNPILIITTISPLVMIVAIIFIRLETEINETGIVFGFVPFSKRRINWEEVQQAEVIDYGFIGGWGLRFTFKYGTVYNVRGRYGLSILLKNGKKLMIGTQKQEELRNHIKSLMSF